MNMKNLLFSWLVCTLATALTTRADVKVVAVKGDIYVRHGVHEEWLIVSPGDVLKPEDSIRSGKKSSATIAIDGSNQLVIPESAIVDISDLRNLTQEEFLLMLAMERVRSVPPRNRNDDFIFPRTTTVHGENIAKTDTTRPPNPELGLLQLNGTKVLYGHGFYATCVLRAKDVFRVLPDLAKMIDIRLIVASALEKMQLNGEAISEYTILLSEELPKRQRDFVEQKIALLKKMNEQME